MATGGAVNKAGEAVLPVLGKKKDIPNSFSDRPTSLEICLAAEKMSGRETIIGAQIIRGLWRIYPASREARSALLVKGLHLRNTMLQLGSTNPFILRDSSGSEKEKESTKVWFDGVPISVAESEFEDALQKNGCELRSNITMERARDQDGKLTRFLTGRRFVFITVPSKPLDKNMTVNFFNAGVYHREQKLMQRKVICSKCLKEGHHMSVCVEEIVCRACKKTGHKRGDVNCELTSEPSAEDRGAYRLENQETNRSAGEGEVRKEFDRRGRSVNRKAADQNRQRPATPKRTLDSPGDARASPKQRRTTEGTLDAWINGNEGGAGAGDGEEEREGDDAGAVGD